MYSRWPRAGLRQHAGHTQQSSRGSGSVSDAAETIQWLNTEEAAQLLGVAQRTLYRFIDEGDLPAYRMGRVIRLKQSEVLAFIDACRIEPGTLASAAERTK